MCKYSFRAFPNATPRAERAESVTAHKDSGKDEDRGKRRVRVRDRGRKGEGGGEEWR